MSTTLKNFVSLNAGTTALAIASNLASGLVSGASATLLDRFTADLSAANYAKNGCIVLSLAASTPQTPSLAALSGVVAGDTAFALVYDLIFLNLSAFDVLVGPGASNAFLGPLLGTTPTFTIPASSQVRWHNPAGWVISGSVKNIKFDPGSNVCQIALCVGGA